MNAIIYTRVSSNEQVKGTSLEDQERKCRQYCSEKNIGVLKVFREEGESAKTSDRTEFLRALEFCRKNKGRVTVFVVVKVDRFARNTEDHFGVRKILLDYGVSLHSVSEPIGNSPVEKLLETVLAGTAEFDNAIRSQRSVDGMIARVRQGIAPWKPPIGYKSNQAKKRGEKKTEADDIDPKIFPIIQRALKRFARGELEQAELTAFLDKEGLSKIRGRKTTKQFIDKILGQYLKFYAGILQNPWVEGEEIDGLHQAMITRDEMNMIVAIREGRQPNKQPRRGYNEFFPLKKTIRCGACNGNLTASRSKGNGGQYGYYLCHRTTCEMKNKTIAKGVVEKEFVELLKSLRPSKEHLALLRATVLDMWEEKRDGFETDAKHFEKQLSNLEKKRQRIFEMREDGSYTKEDFLKRRAEIENEMTAVRISMNESKIDQFDIEGAITYAIKFVEKLDRQWVDLKGEPQVRFQRLIFPEGIPYYKGKGFGTTRMSLMLATKKTAHNEQSLLVTPGGIEPPFQG
jgi:site-specific DNA recombinase